MRIATWNINGVKARIENLLHWLRDAAPDVVCLQEIKCVDEAFPSLEIGDLGYNIAVHGQKSWNGVAILSKRPIEDVVRGLPNPGDDAQARYIEATIGTVRVASIYLPNGNPVDTEKFPYKLAWMDRLVERARHLLDEEWAFVLGGDYNICPDDVDCFDPVGFANDALCRRESRAKYRELVYLGLTEAWRTLHPDEVGYSFWDYQAGCWPRDDGLRIDHLLLSPQAADRLAGASIHKHVRAWDKPSDHVPLVVELDL